MVSRSLPARPDLVGNAIEFNREGGETPVRAVVKSEETTIRVVDTGMAPPGGSPLVQAVALTGADLGQVVIIDEQVTAPVTCLEDFDGDGTVGINDFLDLLAAWGPCPGCPEDLDGDGAVGINDFLAVLAAWGDCP